MPNLGLPELIIIMVIVVLVFGVGRLGEVGSALGKGIREFKKASSGDFDEEKKSDEADKEKKIAAKSEDSSEDDSKES